MYRVVEGFLEYGRPVFGQMVVKSCVSERQSFNLTRVGPQKACIVLKGRLRGCPPVSNLTHL